MIFPNDINDKSVNDYRIILMSRFFWFHLNEYYKHHNPSKNEK